MVECLPSKCEALSSSPSTHSPLPQKVLSLKKTDNLYFSTIYLSNIIIIIFLTDICLKEGYDLF
jgi:hypothetical protein